MWTTYLDLKDAYFHKFLRLAWDGKVYAFIAMPFSLSTAPLVSTEIVEAVVAHLHSQSIFTHSYLDDSLIKNHSFFILHQYTNQVIQLLLNLGFLISWKKLEIVPSQSFIFLRKRYLTDLGLVPPPEEKFLKIQGL
jgi:hypothetical protein